MDRPETVYEVVVDPAGADSPVNDPTRRPSTPDRPGGPTGPGRVDLQVAAASPTAGPSPILGPKVEWELDVTTDRAYFDSNELESVDYPEDGRRDRSSWISPRS